MEKNEIILHGSASEFGDVKTIRRWHLERGWKDIGYNAVIGNGFLTKDDWRKKRYDSSLDGLIMPGRDLNDNPYDFLGEVGAHALGYNENSIGICLISTPEVYPTPKQIWSALIMCAYLVRVELYLISIDSVLGHKEVDSKKIDPYFDMNEFRIVLKRGYVDLDAFSNWAYKSILG